MGHTKEPWQVCFENDWQAATVISNGYEGTIVFSCHPGNSDLHTARADAARIVDCVNAMAGIDNPADFVKSHADLLAALELVQIERDGPESDLLPKARELGLLPGECSVETFVELTIEAAIAKAKGMQ